VVAQREKGSELGKPARRNGGIPGGCLGGNVQPLPFVERTEGSMGHRQDCTRNKPPSWGERKTGSFVILSGRQLNVGLLAKILLVENPLRRVTRPVRSRARAVRHSRRVRHPPGPTRSCRGPERESAAATGRPASRPRGAAQKPLPSGGREGASVHPARPRGSTHRPHRGHRWTPLKVPDDVARRGGRSVPRPWDFRRGPWLRVLFPPGRRFLWYGAPPMWACAICRNG